MTAITLSCEACEAPITGDPHWPHDEGCTGTLDPDCRCDSLVCWACCRECQSEVV